MDPQSNRPSKTRVISVIDGSNLHVSLKAHAQPTRLHYTRLSIDAAKRLPRDLGPWSFLRAFYVTSSPNASDDAAAFTEWRVFQDMLRKTERLELRLGRREGPAGAFAFLAPPLVNPGLEIVDSTHVINRNSLTVPKS